MCMSDLPDYFCAPHTCNAQAGPEEDIRLPGNGVWSLLAVLWVLKIELGSLEEQPVLLSPSPLDLFF